MSRKHHLAIDIQNCKKVILSNNIMIDNFLRNIAKLTRAKIIKSPIVVNRRDQFSGTTGFLITNSANISINTFTSSRDIVIDICSYQNFDAAKIESYILKYFKIDLDSIKITNIAEKEEASVKCGETRCFRKAERIWGGLRVCKDHHDQHQERHEKDMQYLDEY